MKSGEVHLQFNKLTYREHNLSGLLIQLYSIFEESMAPSWTTLC